MAFHVEEIVDFIVNKRAVTTKPSAFVEDRYKVPTAHVKETETS